MAQASPALPAGISLRGNAARRRRETIVRGLFLAASLVTILISVFIIETVLVEAIGFLSQIDLGQLFGIGWFPRRGIFDVATIVIGTLHRHRDRHGDRDAGRHLARRSTSPSTPRPASAGSSSRSSRSSPASPASSSASSP